MNIVALMAAMMILVAPACIGTDRSQPKEREEVLLGVIADLNNRGDEAIIRGADLAVAEYNASPDRTYNVKTRRFNTKGEAGVLDAATRAAGMERIIGVVGPLSDKEALLAAQPLASAGIPTMFPSSTSPDIRVQGWVGFRRLVANRDQLAALLVEEAGRRVNGPIAIMHGPDPWSTAAATAGRAAADKHKVPVARQEAIGDKADLKAIAASLTASPPAGIVLFGEPTRSKGLIDQVRQAGYKGLIAAERLRELPQPPPDSLTTDGRADPASAPIRELSKSYSDRYRTPMPPSAAETFEGAAMLLEAIEEVDPDPTAVAGFLRLNRGFLGETKRYDFDGSGEMLNPPAWIYVAKGGWRLSGVVDPGGKVTF